MRNEFSTFMVFRDGNRPPGFKEVRVAPHHWRSFLAECPYDILLAGGFPRLSPDTSIPLSPTLQINQDVTTRRGSGLEELANAELERSGAVSFSSRLIDANPRICVLGESVEKLERFLANYGGVLEIEAILLQGSHPDFHGAIKASVVAERAGYRVDFTVPAPVDRDLCTYCGKCGSICPEDCLRDNLVIDFSRCSLCRECEHICPVQAIDLSAVEIKNVHVPAVVILSGAKATLPEDRSGIFTEKTLPELFATISAVEIRDVVSCDNKICQYAGRIDSGCRLCQTACPHSSISLDDKGVRVDSRACRECGSCVSVCPTGALQYELFTDSSFYRYFHKVHLHAGTTVIFGSEEDLLRIWWRNKKEQRLDKVFFLEHPNVNALNSMQMLLLFARGAIRILLVHNATSSAADEGEHPGEADMVNTLIESLFDVSDFVITCAPDEVEKYLNPKTDHPLPALFEDPVFNGRRPALAAILEHVVACSPRQLAISQERLPWFASLDCDTNRCSQCLACLNDCKTAALTAEQETLSLLHSPVRCVACGICLQVCPEDALRFAPNLLISTDFFKPVELARGEAMVCRECGKAFGTKKSYERVAAILARRKGEANEYLEYCDTCRVARIFMPETDNDRN